MKLTKDLESELERELLRLAAERLITCPDCDRVLDVDDTVIGSVFIDGSEFETDPLQTHVRCCGCWDKLRPTLDEGIERANDQFIADRREFTAWLQVSDGRNHRGES